MIKKIVPFLLASTLAFSAPQRPNIVYLICDDLGYGDVHCLAPETSKIATPCADQLAKEGMIFTDAHSGSSVCTPTRYGIMTGRYAWRTPLQKGVVTGFAPNIIPKERPTVASFLKNQGYHTAIIGKWHMNFQYIAPGETEHLTRKGNKRPPVGSTIPDGPLTRGFDYFHGFHHAREMEAVMENDRIIKHEDPIHMLPRLTKKVVEYVDSRAGKEKPFFLYVPLGSPHTPILPSKKWQGKSDLGAYGDFVMETDAVLGEISKALDRHGMTKNTLVIFTSDNGCSKAADIPALAKQGHQVSAHLRGSKADIWEGGHRIPFIARWPGKIAPSSTSDQLICLTDLIATTAGILEKKVPVGSAEDSVSFLPALSGEPIVSTRRGVIHHSVSGHFAYRLGKWKLALAKGSGGWSSPKENQVGDDQPPAQLYDLEKDPSEKTNLYLKKPKVVKMLLTHLEEDVARGRTTDGPPSANDFPDIKLWKSEKSPPKKK